MSKMIQVRNVPDRLHAELTRRARRAHRSLTDFIQEVLEREVARPPAEEVFERIQARPRVDLGAPARELIDAERREAGRR
jgi:plasmid stability protein